MPKEGGGYWNSFVGTSTTGQQVTDKTVMFKDGDLMEQMINDVISSICAVIYREKTLTNRYMSKNLVFSCFKKHLCLLEASETWTLTG